MTLGALISFMIAHRGWADWRRGSVWGEKLAAFSYSFYVVHFPITVVVLGLLFRLGGIRHRLPLDAKGLAVALATLAVAIVFARIFAFFTEDRTLAVRHIMLGPKRSNTVVRKPESEREISA